MKAINISGKKAAMLVLCLTISAANASAIRVSRDASKYLLDRTNLVLLAAQAELKAGQVYTGNLAKAIAHQRYATSLWVDGNYADAVNHSYRARVLALSVINVNNGIIKAAYDFDKAEQRYIKSAPHDEQLDKVLEKDLSYYYKQDQDFITAVIDDMELADFE